MHIHLAGAERVFGHLLARMMRHNLASDLRRLAELARADYPPAGAQGTPRTDRRDLKVSPTAG